MSRISYLKNKLKRKKAKKMALRQPERKPKRTFKIKKAVSDRPDKSFLLWLMEHNELIAFNEKQYNLDQ